MFIFFGCDLFPTMDVEDIFCEPDQPSLAVQSNQCDGVANSKSTKILYSKDEGNGVTYYVVENLDPLGEYDVYTKFQADSGYTDFDTFYVTKDSSIANVGNTSYNIDEINEIGFDSFAYISTQFRDIYKGHYNNNPVSEISDGKDQRRIVIECESWAEVGDKLYLVTNNND